MKKIIIVCAFLLILCGCSNVKDLSNEQIISTIGDKSMRENVNRGGYKYYLPQGLSIEDSEDFNEVLYDGKNKYYLYVDALSYIKKIDNKYKSNQKSYYSQTLTYGKKYGYVEINNLENNKYLIEIMYNYAKIEVMVNEDDINRTLLTSINLLKSIKYNNEIIENLFGKDVLNFMEEEFNIFHTTSSDSTYIQIDDTYHEPVDDSLPDTDLIN